MNPTYGRLTSDGDRWVLSVTGRDVAVYQQPLSAFPSEADGQFLSYVYGLLFTIHGHKFDQCIRYVGKAGDPRSRFYQHMRADSGCRRVCRCFSKYGRNAFRLVILEVCAAGSVEDADALSLSREVAWISQLGTTRRGIGLNLSSGGEGALLSPEAHRRYLEGIERRRTDLVSIANHRRGMAQLHADPVRSAPIKTGIRRRWAEMSPEEREQISRATSEKLHNSEVNAKRQMGLKRAYADPAKRLEKAETARQLHADPEYKERRRVGLERWFSDSAAQEKKSRRVAERHIGGAFTRSAKIGISLRWAGIFAERGDTIGLNRHIEKLVRFREQDSGLSDEAGAQRRAQELLGRLGK